MKFNRKRVSFKDLFEYDEKKNLVLKRKMKIGQTSYNIGDKFQLDQAPKGFPEKPEKYYYVYTPYRDGDAISKWLLNR